ncbi:MAG TPA: DUF4129 domain-containing protein [Actinomycetes bacterium]|nr:DUF4129 domain-containing protein [Actinomycetes bacterium]
MAGERTPRTPFLARPRRALAVAGVAGLLGVVAAGSLGSPLGAPPGRGRPRFPVELVEVLAVLGLLAGLAALALLLAAVRGTRPRRFPPHGRAAVSLALLVLLVVAAWALPRIAGPAGDRPAPQVAPATPTAPAAGRDPVLVRPGWTPVVLTALALAAAAAALAARGRPGRPARADGAPAAGDPGPAPAAGTAPEGEQDPRRAVLAAYAQLERDLAAHGLARGRSETPREHLARALAAPGVPGAPATRLADLFELARFSRRRIDAGMRGQALAALGEVRRGLRGAAARGGDGR